jgi:CDP-glucose 4,6-dehydratase
MTTSFWAERRVLLTGHTGFKGGWLALMLQRLGAEVSGLALAPDTDPSLYALLQPVLALRSRLGDMRDEAVVRRAVAESNPEIVIHMAAQALVRRSYAEPVATFASNVMGTAHLLEALRTAAKPKAVLVVTSDKVYANDGTANAFAEGAPLGGHDPYSASKAATEITTAAWSASFLAPAGIALATARAGNVVGGGDFAADRIVPDIWRARRTGRPLLLRNPEATRPWQHVLDPLAGYLAFAERLATSGPGKLPPALNFGPRDDAGITVAGVAERMLAALDEQQGWVRDASTNPPEQQTLALDTTLAQKTLGWHAKLGTDEALAWTADWYRTFDRGEDVIALMQRQIERHEALA